MERLLIAFLFIVLPMILNAIEQKKKRQARERRQDSRPPTPSRDRDVTLEEWIESMQRKAEERAGAPTRTAPKPAPKPVIVAEAPPPPPTTTPAAAPNTAPPRRSESSRKSATSQRKVPERRASTEGGSLTAAERARARSQERAAERERNAGRPDEEAGRGSSQDAARKAIRARTATRERDRKETLSARKVGGGGASLDFGGRDDLRRAIVLREVFGPPRALEDLD